MNVILKFILLLTRLKFTFKSLSYFYFIFNNNNKKKHMYNFFLKKSKYKIKTYKLKKTTQHPLIISLIYLINPFKQTLISINIRKCLNIFYPIKRRLIKNLIANSFRKYILKKKIKRNYRILKNYKTFIKKNKPLFLFSILNYKKKRLLKKIFLKKKMSLFIFLNDFLKLVLFKSFKGFNLLKKRVKAQKGFYERTINKFSKYLKHEKKNLKIPKQKRMFNIKKIKFKNSYIIMWKKARKGFSEYNNIRYIYQKQLTKKLFFFSKFSYINFFFNFFKIKNFIYCLIPTICSYSNTLSNIFYVNGTKSTDPNYILLKNDFISILLTFHILNLNSIFKKNNYLKRKKLFSWFSFFYKRVKYSLFKKKKSSYPNKIKNYFLSKNDVYSFIEFDYSSMSGFVLYNDLLVQNVNKFNFYKYNSYIYKNYNWKTIT